MLLLRWEENLWEVSSLGIYQTFAKLPNTKIIGHYNLPKLSLGKLIYLVELFLRNPATYIRQINTNLAEQKPN